MIFKNFSFMFYLASDLASRISGQETTPLIWMAIILTGGAIVIGSILMIGNLMAIIFEPTDATHYRWSSLFNAAIPEIIALPLGTIKLVVIPDKARILRNTT